MPKNNLSPEEIQTQNLANLKKELEDFDWSILFADRPQGGFLKSILPVASFIIQVAILVLVIKG